MPSRITYKRHNEAPTARLLKVRGRQNSFGRTSIVKDLTTNLTVMSRNIPYHSTLNEAVSRRRGAGRSMDLAEEHRTSETPSKNTPMAALYTLPKISN